MRDRTTPGVLATISFVPIHVFNPLIKRGIPRDAALIMTEKLMAMLELRPKVYESVPWGAELAPPLDSSIAIPDPRGSIPTKSHHGNIDREICKKIIWTFALLILVA